jgi:uncharacterized protein (UPF0548 family)
VFTLSKPTETAVAEDVAAAASMRSTSPRILSLHNGLDRTVSLPFGFAHDLKRTTIGEGAEAFAAAKLAFRRWAMFDLSWVRIANPEAAIAEGQMVAVEAHTLGLWSLNLSRITEVVDTPSMFGFLYLTTEMHVEQGEERFILEFDATTRKVCYELEAVSRPLSLLARLGFPFTRSCQHRFASDSHRRMRAALIAISLHIS